MSRSWVPVRADLPALPAGSLVLVDGGAVVGAAPLPAGLGTAPMPPTPPLAGAAAHPLIAAKLAAEKPRRYTRRAALLERRRAVLRAFQQWGEPVQAADILDLMRLTEDQERRDRLSDLTCLVNQGLLRRRALSQGPRNTQWLYYLDPEHAARVAVYLGDAP